MLLTEGDHGQRRQVPHPWYAHNGYTAVAVAAWPHDMSTVFRDNLLDPQTGSVRFVRSARVVAGDILGCHLPD